MLPDISDVLDASQRARREKQYLYLIWHDKDWRLSRYLPEDAEGELYVEVAPSGLIDYRTLGMTRQSLRREWYHDLLQTQAAPP